jgi:predicted transcriptional regulator
MELNFACRKISIEQLLKCTFSLTSSEVKVLKVMDCSKELSIKELEKKLNKDRSTVQRAVKSLADKNLIIRKQYNLETGGYIFTYRCIRKAFLKEKMKKTLDEFHKSVEKAIDQF